MNSDYFHSIILSKGSKVRLKTNLWTDAGLTNGAKGEVHSIIYDTNSKAGSSIEFMWEMTFSKPAGSQMCHLPQPWGTMVFSA